MGSRALGAWLYGPAGGFFLFPAKNICKAQGVLPSLLYGVSRKCCSQERFLPTALSGIAFIIIIAVDQMAHSAATPCSLSKGAEPEQRRSASSLDCKKVDHVRENCLCKSRQKRALRDSTVFVKCSYLGQGNHHLASTEDVARERIRSKDATKPIMGSPLYTVTSQR